MPSGPLKALELTIADAMEHLGADGTHAGAMGEPRLLMAAGEPSTIASRWSSGGYGTLYATTCGFPPPLLVVGPPAGTIRVLPAMAIGEFAEVRNWPR